MSLFHKHWLDDDGGMGEWNPPKRKPKEWFMEGHSIEGNINIGETMSKKKEVATQQQSTAVVEVNDSEFDNVGPDQNITASDIMIPRVLCMQPMSPKVVEGECQFGDLRDNLEWELLASVKKGDTPAKSLVVLPFHWEKYWIQKKMEGNQFKFETMKIMDSSNEKLDAFETWKGEDGVERKREYLHLFYVLLQGKSIPYTIGFKGASKKAGDALVTQMYTINKGLKNVEAYTRSPMGKLVEITPVKLTKGSNTYMAMEVRPFEASNRDQAVEALTWYKNVASGLAKADLTDDDEVIETTSKEF